MEIIILIQKFIIYRFDDYIIEIRLLRMIFLNKKLIGIRFKNILWESVIPLLSKPIIIVNL